MSQFGPLNRILILLLGPVTAVPPFPDFAIQPPIFYGCNYGKTFSYSCHAAACLYTSQVFSSSSSIMENAIWRMAAGQLGGEKCHVAIAWHASKFGRAKVNSRFSAVAWIFFLRSVVGCAQLKPHRQRERTLWTTDRERTPRLVE